MELMPIVPLPYLHLADQNNKHLILSGLLKEHQYFEYYKKRRSQGDYIILDPGSYENHQLDVREYVSFGEEIDVQELMVPDAILDTKRTIELADEFFDRVEPSFLSHFRLEIVPQGRTFQDYKWCLHELLIRALKVVPKENIVIGISKASGDVAVREITLTSKCHINRPLAVKFVHALCPRIEIHLLGLVDPVELFSYCDDPLVTGVDTTAPFNHAICGKSYAKDWIFEEYPSFETLPRIDLKGPLKEEELGLATNNLRLLTKFCRSVGRR